MSVLLNLHLCVTVWPCDRGCLLQALPVVLANLLNSSVDFPSMQEHFYCRCFHTLSFAGAEFDKVGRGKYEITKSEREKIENRAAQFMQYSPIFTQKYIKKVWRLCRRYLCRYWFRIPLSTQSQNGSFHRRLCANAASQDQCDGDHWRSNVYQ